MGDDLTNWLWLARYDAAANKGKEDGEETRGHSGTTHHTHTHKS